MTRSYEIAGLVAIVVSMLALYEGLSAAGSEASTGAVAPSATSSMLVEAGLLRREDVVIELDGQEVAQGFSREDCDGLLLIARLPHTAQSWSHLAPRLDLSNFIVRYLYDGDLYERVPRLKRLGDRLLADLGSSGAADLPHLMAVAEAGNCQLIPSVVEALGPFPRGSNFYG